MAAAYERRWFVEPKDAASSASTGSDKPKSPVKTTSPTEPPKRTVSVRRPFIPALPSNPRPIRRQSEDIRNVPQDTQTPPRPRAGSNSAQAPPPLPILKSPKTTRGMSIRSSTRPPPLKIPTPERINSDAASSSSLRDATPPMPPTPKVVESPRPSPADAKSPKISKTPTQVTVDLKTPRLTESPKRIPTGWVTPDPLLQDAMYLKVVDIPPSQRSSDTMPNGFSLEPADKEAEDVLTASPANLTPSALIKSLAPAGLASPPSSSDERSPLTPLAEIQPELQPAPLNLKTQLPAEATIVEPSAPPPPPKTLSPPPENDLPPLPESKSTELSQPAQQPYKHSMSVKFKRESSNEPRRKPSNTSSLGPLAPRSLATHLLALGNTPRKLYLATHSPFLRAVCASKVNTALLSNYLARERLCLHSTLRLLSLLLANIILPIRPSGLVTKRRGGVREKMREEIEKAERERKEKAQKGQKDFGPGMGANIGVEVAAGTANLGMGMVLGGIAGIATGVGMKVATGSAGVGLSNLGNSATDPPPEDRISEVIENVHKDVGERAVDFLVAAISRTRRTLDLFEEVSEDISGIDLDGTEQAGGDGSEMSALTMFVRLFGEIGGAVEKRERSVLVGLVMLYAREKAHLDSWLEVKASLSTQPQQRPQSVSLSQKRRSEPDRGVIRVYLLPCFTGDESTSYVEDLGKLVNDLWTDKYVKRDQDSRFSERKDTAEKKKVKLRGGGSWDEDIRELEELFEMVLDIQARFWPEVQ
ncbi:uncharacterized protein PAC_00186 [Phialocephala subalpina]|uniref:Uncharacterized protein n=1 Tax=Phialocephala subalpina TaxID=576137 RepID=A0A1L7WC28_9HELO|nr:uncharacterized protein PAC_00186 [Phialocephala subalpina]